MLLGTSRASLGFACLADGLRDSLQLPLFVQTIDTHSFASLENRARFANGTSGNMERSAGGDGALR